MRLIMQKVSQKLRGPYGYYGRIFMEGGTTTDVNNVPRLSSLLLIRRSQGQISTMSSQTPPDAVFRFVKTDLANRGWDFADLAQYLYASVQRGARELLEERGTLPVREKHRNGVEWVFWAEEESSDK